MKMMRPHTLMVVAISLLGTAGCEVEVADGSCVQEDPITGLPTVEPCSDAGVDGAAGHMPADPSTEGTGGKGGAAGAGGMGGAGGAGGKAGSGGTGG